MVKENKIAYFNVEKIRKKVDRIRYSLHLSSYDKIKEALNKKFSFARSNEIKKTNATKNILIYSYEGQNKVQLVRLFNKYGPFTYVQLLQPNRNLILVVNSLLTPYKVKYSQIEYAVDLYPKTRSRKDQKRRCEKMLDTFFHFLVYKKGFSGKSYMYNTTIYMDKIKKKKSFNYTNINKGAYGTRIYVKGNPENEYFVRLEIVMNSKLLRKLNMREIDKLPLNAESIDFNEYFLWVKNVSFDYAELRELISAKEDFSVLQKNTLFIAIKNSVAMCKTENDFRIDLNDCQITNYLNLHRTLKKKFKILPGKEHYFVTREFDIENSRFYLDPFYRK